MTEASDLALAARLRALAGAAGELRHDSRAVRPGDVFAALPGQRDDGARWLGAARAAGAAALLCDSSSRPLVDPGLAPEVIFVPRLRERLGPLAAAFYDHPGAAMTGLAVTGTNGKTSVSLWTAALLNALGRPCAALGTLGAWLPDGSRLDSGLTTPQASDTQRLLARARAAGAQAFALEASSIGLEQGRLSGTPLSAAAFTNLTRDHLDYHGDMAAYEEAKGRLFAWPGLRRAVINGDDPAGRRLIERCRAAGLPVTVFGLGAEAAGRADLWADGIGPGPAGVSFRIHAGDLTRPLDCPVIGRFNVANLLAALGLVLSLPDIDRDSALAALTRLPQVPGRLERVSRPGAPLVVVDYAHTPDALDQVVRELGELARSRGGLLWCLCGAGGDRDRGKRRPMGEAASRADRVIVTSDNPRGEDPALIAAEVAAGAPGATLEPDRRRAIAMAVSAAAPADVVLLAGKGHEDYQEIRGRRCHFSDVEEARAALSARAAGAGEGT